MRIRNGIAAIGILLALAGCGGGGDGGDDTSSSSTPHSVTLSVSASGPVDVTFATADGGTAQQRSASGFFSTSFMARPGTFLYVSGQVSSSSALASVSARITVDGATLKSTSSIGPFVIATASGSCC